MGYTHSWKYLRARLLPSMWSALKLDTLVLLSHLPEHSRSAGAYYDTAPLKLTGTNGSPPVVTDERIVFNGAGVSTIDPGTGKHSDDGEERLGCEHFCLYQNWRAAVRGYLKENPHSGYYQGVLKQRQFNDFCKTERRPYDLVVCAVLAVAVQRAPGWLHLYADDGSVNDWKPAVEWASEVLDRKINNPINGGIIIGEVDEAGAVQVGEGVLACSSR